MWSTQPGEYELWTEIMLALGTFVQYNSYLKKADVHNYASLHRKMYEKYFSGRKCVREVKMRECHARCVRLGMSAVCT